MKNKGGEDFQRMEWENAARKKGKAPKNKMCTSLTKEMKKTVNRKIPVKKGKRRQSKGRT